MSAAGAAWGVATACAQGWLEECKCVRPSHFAPTSADDPLDGGSPNSLDSFLEPPPLEVADDWSWQGCSYGVNYAISTSRKLFTRTGPLRAPLRRLEKHNLKAGRLVSGGQERDDFRVFRP